MNNTILLTILLIIIWLSYLHTNANQRNLQNTPAILFIILSILLIYLKFDTTDKDAYLQLYNIPSIEKFFSIDLNSINERYEPLFKLLMLSSSSIYLSATMFYGLLGLTSLFLLFYSLKKQPIDIAINSIILYIALYYIFNEHIQIRQGIATNLILLHIYLRSIKSKYAYLPAFIAPSFHYTSVAALPFLFILNSNSKQLYLYSFLIALIIGYIADNLNAFKTLSSTGLLPNSMTAYITHSLYGSSANLLSLGVLKSIVISYCIFYLWDNLKNNKHIFLCAKLFILGAVIQLLLLDFYIASIRFSKFLLVTEILLIPYILLNLTTKKITSVLIIIFSTTYIVRLIFQ